MGDVRWTLNLFMKDAPRGKNFLSKRMERDLICYFNIFGLVEKYGYTTRDHLYCSRDRHGRRRARLVKITNDKDVDEVLFEHEEDQKLNFFVEKHDASLNTAGHSAVPIHNGESDDAWEGYDTESSNGTDHETYRDELQTRADPSLHPKQKWRRNSSMQLDDQYHDEGNGGDLDDHLEPIENGEEDEEILQDSPAYSEDEDQDVAELDTTVSGLSPEFGPIKIIWPNGFVQEYRRRFTVSNVMNIKSGGKVTVETDRNGIPNQRSAGLLGSFLRDLARNSSHVPLHIPRWDNKLLRKTKQDLITYVKTKFVYPEETKHATEGWMLKIVNKGWRDYKSLLKNKYYKPKKWSLDQIKKRVPSGVNRHQWISLLGIWCQEQHAKTCERNSEAGKQQRHPHTTGRKSHARLRKEMEVNNKGPVSKIDLWDEAHKKKDGQYTNENVQQLMHKARKKLANLQKKKNGELSPEDYDKVFDDVIAKESTIGGYYNEKYWGDARLCGGSTSVQESSSEVKLKKELEEVKVDLRNVNGFMKRMCAFMSRNHPDEDWMNEMMATGNKTSGQLEDPDPMLQSNNISMSGQPEEDPDPMLQSTNISTSGQPEEYPDPMLQSNNISMSGPPEHPDPMLQSTNISTSGQPEEESAPMLQSNNILVKTLDRVGGRHEVVVEEPMDNVQATKSDPKVAQFAKDCTSQDIRNRSGKESTRKESPEQQTSQQSTRKESPEQQTSQQVNVSKRFNTAESSESIQTSNKKTKRAHVAKAKEHCQNSSSREQTFVKASTTKELLKHRTTQKKQKIVVLVSLTPSTKGLVVGKGIIESRDRKYVVGGDMLGDAFWAITVLDVSRLGSEKLPRPLGDFQTVEDAIGHCIAWPCTHVKRVKDDSK